MKARLKLLAVVLITAAIAGPIGAALALRVSGRAAGPTTPSEADTTYQCPMHPAVQSDHPGQCPICGMTLVKTSGSHERQPRFYRSPMDPSVTSPTPAKDSMGMEFLPVYDEAPAPASTVAGLAPVDIDARRQQLIGLRTGKVDRGVLDSALRAPARVSVDEAQVRRVTVRVGGYVEHLAVESVGKPVRRGQPLFTLYSPEVLATESEYLAAVIGGGGLESAARRKLELAGVPEAELQRLEREHTAARTVTFVAPASGVITKKDVVEGARLEAGSSPLELADLSTVWVLADIYEPELRLVTVGAQATLRLTAFPGKSWTGKVLFLDPMLDPKTRTARARLAFDNASGELRPELFGEVTISRPPREVLRVPTDALVRSGGDDVVFLAQAGGHFVPRRVVVGEVGRATAEVLEGLAEGDEVVVGANFLVDSEARLRASLSRLAPPAAPATSEGPR